MTAFTLPVARLVPLPVAARLALPGRTFLTRNGLFTSPAQLTPLLIGIVVSLPRAVTEAPAHVLLPWDDFINPTDDGSACRTRSPWPPCRSRGCCT